ncbi:hypothetical protein G6F31_013025 [Rhizopus arrhizus]|nr:hypothetical protein G6F31_013025 [Rhizopus arrhizus]
MARDGHHRAGAVAHQHEVGDPDRHLLAGDRVQGTQAGVHAALFLGFQFSLGHAALLQVGQHRRQFRIVLRRVQRQRVLGGDRHEGHAHHGVRAGGEHAQRIQHTAVHVTHIELDLQAFGTADPVALHGLDRFRPALQLIQAVQQFLGVVGDAQEPLWDLALLDQGTGTPAAAVDHLLVGQHGLVDRVPVHHRVAAVGQALAHQPGEHALLVDVVVRTAGGKLARPVDGIAQRLQLAAHVVDVLVGPRRRRGLVLDRGIFRRQAERVPAHGLQHVVPGHALVAADHVTDGVIAHVPHVQRTGRVRKHRQAVVLRLVRSLVDLEGTGGIPEALGGGFNLLRVVGVGFSAGHGTRGCGGKAVQRAAHAWRPSQRARDRGRARASQTAQQAKATRCASGAGSTPCRAKAAIAASTAQMTATPPRALPGPWRRWEMPSNRAPATNPSTQTIQALACSWLAGPSRSSTSSGSSPIAAKARPASSSIWLPTRGAQPAVAGRRRRRHSATTVASTPGSTKPSRLNPSACGTPCAPGRATGWRACA